jgi:hypothetical protein
MTQPLFIYAHIEKCGGTTINSLCRSVLGTRHVDIVPRDKEAMLINQQDLDDTLRICPGAISLSGHSIRPHLELDFGDRAPKYFTLLRDPVKRYVSDYKHFVELCGFTGSFEDWLEVEDRQNFQVRAIAGNADLAAAKEIVQNRVALCGCLEEFDAFMNALQRLMSPHGLGTEYHVANQAGQRDQRPFQRILFRAAKGFAKPPEKAPAPQVDVTPYLDAIEERNQLDRALHRFVKEEVFPSQAAALATHDSKPARPATRGRLRNMLFRNLIYKPRMGYPPFVFHSLPRYRNPS